MSFDGVIPVGFYALEPGYTESAALAGFDGIIPLGFFGLEFGYTEAAVTVSTVIHDFSPIVRPNRLMIKK